MSQYNPKEIEPKWQKKWLETGINQNYNKAKTFYALDMFPYPSGVGLHVGHPKGYIATDVVSRFKMLQGYSVLHPMGWDAFGLPAENYAIKMKMHPRIAVEKNIATFKRQLEMFGFTYDWDREINTTDPEYYKWTQWIFLKMFEKGLAYESEEPVNWCPSCKTVLANEDLEKGLCERCGSQIVQKKIRQWVLKMTDYADRLLYDLDTEGLDWEEMIKEQQRNWIGRSEGAQFEMKIKNGLEKIEVYTTRLDTVFGMTYAVVAPEHSIIEKLKDKVENYSEVEKYVIQAQNKTHLERTDLQKEKTGIELKGIKVINPFNQEEIPLFVADYVLGFYGTGAVMAVPAHDERDWEFAKKYDLPIKYVIQPCFDQLTEPGKIKEGEPFAERNAITALVKHWEKYEYIALKWKKVAWRTLITGGVENGQTPEEAARAEVLEETGYKNPKLIKALPMVHSRFYHIPKKENRYAHFHVFYFQLENGEQNQTSDKEQEIHEVEWVSKDKMDNYFTAEPHNYIWQTLDKLETAYVNDGALNNSEAYNFLSSEEARGKMIAWLEKEGIGQKKINYKMRDWVFSRQRYWGEPVPIVHCEKCGAVAVPESELPLKLPEVEKYEPTDTGESPLANITEWVNTTCPKCGGPAKRETNTMPQWAGSSWYYLRYIDPKNSEALIDKDKEKKWMPVDLYVGGAEHATRHLLYARFWHKFLYDIGVVSTKEPFKKLVHVGLINGEDGRKMSKRWGNVINPDQVIGEFGADAMRVFGMFMGPFTQEVAWSTAGVNGARRFLEKVWNFARQADLTERSNGEVVTLLNKTIKKVTEDIENFRFNTAISALMILINKIFKTPEELKISNRESERKIGEMSDNKFGLAEWISKDDFEKFIKLLSPFAPHIVEEIWKDKLGHKESIFLSAWPQYDPGLIKDEKIKLVVQVNGKVRDMFEASMDISEDEAKELTMQREKVKKFIEGKEIKKVIFVPGKLINIVVQ